MVDFIFEKKRKDTQSRCWKLLPSATLIAALQVSVVHIQLSCYITCKDKKKKKKERVENPCCLLIRKKLRYRAKCVLLWLLVWVCSLPGAQRFLWRLESVFAGAELPHHQAKLILIRNSTRDTLFIKYTTEIIVWYRNLWFYVLFMLLCHQQQEQCVWNGDYYWSAIAKSEVVVMNVTNFSSGWVSLQ